MAGPERIGDQTGVLRTNTADGWNRNFQSQCGLYTLPLAVRGMVHFIQLVRYLQTLNLRAQPFILWPRIFSCSFDLLYEACNLSNRLGNVSQG